MTLKQAQATLRAHGIVLIWKPELGEYRVNFQRGHERTAYYTNDRDDAVATGLDMARRQPRENPRVPLWNTPGHIPGEALEIKYRRSPGKFFYHNFRPGVRQRRNANGSITLYHPTHRLWADDREAGFWNRYGDRHNPQGRSTSMSPAMKYLLWAGLAYLIFTRGTSSGATATASGAVIAYWFQPDTLDLKYLPATTPPLPGYRPASEYEIATYSQPM